MSSPSPQKAKIITLGLGTLITSCFIPKHFIHIVPLPASLVFLQWLIDEYYYFSPWLEHQPVITASPNSSSFSDEDPLEAKIKYNKLLGHWYSSWMNSTGVLTPIVTLPLTLGTSFRILYTNYQSSSSFRDIGYLGYLGGLGLTLIHMPAGRKAFPLVSIIGQGGTEEKDGKGKDALMALDRWLGMHWDRLVWVDIPMVLCFLVGTVMTMKT